MFLRFGNFSSTSIFWLHARQHSSHHSLMKILSEREAFLLDYEVLQHLNGFKEQYNWSFSAEDDAKAKKKKRSTEAGVGLESITRDVTQYLAENATAEIGSPEAFAEFMAFLNTLDLMKAEKLQIVNSLPRSMVHLYGLVEECDQRFSEETCESIIAKVDSLFPRAEAEEFEEEEEVS